MGIPCNVTPAPPPHTCASVATVGISKAGLADLRETWKTLSSNFASTSAMTLRLSPFSFTTEGITEFMQAEAHHDAFLLAPRLTTWSRLPHLNRHGPRPLRSAEFPWGLPSLAKHLAERVNEENALYRLLLDAMVMIMDRIPSQSRPRPLILLHPEDLGAVFHQRPASPWQLSTLKELAKTSDFARGALHQCRLGPCANSQPTGFMTNMKLVPGTFKEGWPKLHSVTKKYLGPLSRACGCGQRHNTVVRRGRSFKTLPDAVQPSTAKYLTEAIFWNLSHDFSKQHGPPAERGAGLAVLLPQLKRYRDADDSDQDSDGTVFIDPPSESPCRGPAGSMDERFDTNTSLECDDATMGGTQGGTDGFRVTKGSLDMLPDCFKKDPTARGQECRETATTEANASWESANNKTGGRRAVGQDTLSP